MPALSFRLRKPADAKAQLILVREDGSQTFGAIGPANAYGPVHDLTHFAIESTLGLAEGFLGLCASGWEIADFEVKGTAKLLPLEAIFAEVAAGELSRQILMRQPWTLEEWLWAIDRYFETNKIPGTRPAVSEAQYAEINAIIAREWARWRELPAGGTLELTYHSPRPATVAAPTPAERAKRALSR